MTTSRHRAGVCRICGDPRRTYMEALLLQGRSYLSLSEEFGINRSAIGRHSREHMPVSAVKVNRPGRKPAGSALPEPPGLPDASGSDRLAVLVVQVEQQLRAASATGSPQQVVAVARELRALLRDQRAAESAEGGSAGGAVLDLHTSPEWIATRDAIHTALTPFPDARVAVAAALAKLGAGEPPETGVSGPQGTGGTSVYPGTPPEAPARDLAPAAASEEAAP